LIPKRDPKTVNNLLSLLKLINFIVLIALNF